MSMEGVVLGGLTHRSNPLRDGGVVHKSDYFREERWSEYLCFTLTVGSNNLTYLLPYTALIVIFAW